METKIDITEGKKLSESEQSEPDASKVGKLSAGPSQAPVEGQRARGRYVRCPYCSAVGYLVEDTNVYQYYTCHNCGRTFTF